MILNSKEKGGLDVGSFERLILHFCISGDDNSLMITTLYGLLSLNLCMGELVVLVWVWVARVVVVFGPTLLGLSLTFMIVVLFLP